MIDIKIFGFSGKIGVGKNYIAEKLFGKRLHEMGYNVHILSFGDQLKFELGARFNKIVDVSELDAVYSELFVNKSAETRKKLQFYGTEYGRNGADINIGHITLHHEPMIWVKGLYLQICSIIDRSYDTSKDIFIICDVRFKNEADFIKTLHGSVIRIESPTRNKAKLHSEAVKTLGVDIMDTEKCSNHESETNLDSYCFDHIINNEPENAGVASDVYDILKILMV